MPLPPPNPASLEHNRRVLDRSRGATGYTGGLGLAFVDHAHGYVKFRLPASGTATDEHACIAPGAFLSAVDHVGAIAAWTTSELGNPRYFGSTVRTQIEIMTEVRDDVDVEGRAVSIDGELIYADVTMTTDSGEIVAKGSTIYRIIDRGE